MATRATLEDNARVLETIDVLERRLRMNLTAADEDNNQQDDAGVEAEEDDDLFSPLHRVLYTHMLGEAYMTLATKHGHTFYYGNAAVLEEFASRAEAAFRSAVNLSALINLEATSQLRLLATCSLCRFLVVVRQRHRRARRLANKLFAAATLHSHHVSDASLGLLQLLRDSYMPVLSEAKRRAEEERGEAYSSDESSVEEEEGEDDEEEDEDEGLFDEDGNRIEDDVEGDGEGEGEGEEAEGEEEAGEEGEGKGEGEGEQRVAADPSSSSASATPDAKKTSKPPSKSKPSPSPSPAATATPSKPKPKDKGKDKAETPTGATPSTKAKDKDKDKDKGVAASTGKASSKGSGKGKSSSKGSAKPGAAASTGKGKKGDSKGKKKDKEEKEDEGKGEAGAGAGGIGWMTPRQRKAVGLVRGLRRLVSSLPQAQPILLQNPAFPQAADLRRALSRLFAVYVRGAGLPAHAGADYTVTVDGQRLTFSSYVLSGPYISWRGVCGVLRDFSLARLPSKAKAPSFPQIYDPPGAVREFRQGGQPPVTIKQAALLFLESSRSACPVLTLDEYKEAYREIAATEKALALRIAQEPASASASASASAGAGGGGGGTDAEICAAVSGPAGVKSHEAWGRALLWAAAGDEDDWAAITSGLNFMQFLDFLGKLALVAYSSPKFDAALPSPTKKVEHFLVAQMGLGDARRWLPKADARIFALKYSIEKLTSAAVAAHPAAAAATTQALLMAKTQQQQQG